VRRDSILTAVERYYSEKFAEHGPSARGVDWNSTESQELRFAQLARLFGSDRRDFSVNDLGCGYGAFAAYLTRFDFEGSYMGYELSPAMLAHAQATVRDRPRFRFRRGSTLQPADYSVASGIFNIKLAFDGDEWAAYIWETIDELAHASRKGFAFNMLTAYSDTDKRRPDLYYAEPSVTFDTCVRRYSREVALLHDYGLWEFTVIVRTP
jgi:SAM-dependent methyltransferase